MPSLRLLGPLLLVLTGLLAATAQPAPAAQVCGCKNAKGRISKLGVPPLTCSPTKTLICWNEDPPPGDISARVYNSANISIPNQLPGPGNPYPVLTFDSERWDTANIHDTSTNTSRLTAPTSGKYLMYGHVQFAANPNGNRSLLIARNGSGVLAIMTVPGGSETLSVATYYELNAGDYVELWAVQNSGGPLDVLAACGPGSYCVDFGMVKLP